MITPDRDIRALADPASQLERAFIDEFVRSSGYDPAHLNHLPDAVVRPLLGRACAYAAAKLAEVECRAHYTHEIHGR